MKRIKHLMFLLGVTLALWFGATGCQTQHDFKQSVAFPDAQWHQHKAAAFDYQVTQPAAYYTISFALTHGRTYPYSNIWLFVEIQAPNGNTQRDTVEFALADDHGKWYGKKNGDLWQYLLHYKPQVAFPETGKYTFRLIQGMRNETLTDVQQIDLIIDQHRPTQQ